MRQCGLINNEVVGNVVTGSTYAGIAVVRGSTGNLIKENEVSDNGGGIFLSRANNNQVLENKVTGSTYDGIRASRSSGNLIKENKVSDSGSFDLFDSSVPPPLDNTWQDNEYDTANF